MAPVTRCMPSCAVGAGATSNELPTITNSCGSRVGTTTTGARITTASVIDIRSVVIAIPGTPTRGRLIR